MNFKNLFRRNPPTETKTLITSKEMPLTEVESKAFIADTAVNQWQFFFGQSSNKYYSPKQLLQYNTGWVFVCNNRNAMTISTIPYKLYYRNKSGKSLKYAKGKAISNKQMKFLEKTTQKEMSGNVLEIEEHDVLELLHNPNPRMNYTDFTGMIQSYLGLIGNSYVYKQRDKTGKVIALYPLLSENVSAVVQENGFGYGDILNYKYTSTFNQSTSLEERVMNIPTEDIIHFLNYQPGNALYGKGELEAAICCAEREFYYDQTENYLNRNNARPDFLVTYKNGMTENQQKEIQRLWFKKYGTPMNAGKPMVTNGDVDVKQLNFSPRDMQYVMGRTEVRREVCAVFGVPNSLVDINDANRASAQSGLDYYKQTTVLPKLQKFLEKLNEQLVEDYDENLFVWFDGDMIISSDEKEAAEIDRIYLDEGIYGATYVRNRLGIETDQPDALRALPTAMRMTSTSKDPSVSEEVDNNTNINQE